MNRARRLAALSAFALTATLSTVLGGPVPSALADSRVLLDFISAGDIVVDDSHDQVFVSEGDRGSRVVALSYSGAIQQEFTGLSDPLDMVLSPDQATLYVTLRGTAEIAVIDTASLTVTRRVDLGAGNSCPSDPVFTGGRVWFVYGCPSRQFGSLDHTTGALTLELGIAPPGLLRGLSNRPDRLTLVSRDNLVQVYDVSGGTPTTPATWTHPGTECRDAMLHNGGDQIVLACEPNTYVYNTIDGSGGTLLPNLHLRKIAVAATPNAQFIAGGGPDDPEISVFSTADPNTPIRTVDTAGNLVDAGLAWSDTGRLFALSTPLTGSGIYFTEIVQANLQRIELVVKAGKEMPINRASTISGTLTSAGHAIESAQIDITRTTNLGITTLPSATTNVLGRFSFADTPGIGGRVTYAISFDGGATHADATAVVHAFARALRWDVNGDGFADLVTGAVTEDLAAVRDAGIVHAILSSPTGPVGTTSAAYTQDSAGVPDVAQSGDQLGFTQASGDFNADGYADVAVSANTEDLGTVRNSGLVHVFYGSATGLRTDNSRTFSLLNTAYGARSNAFFGDALAAGDFNGDGYHELAIGASGFGRVFVVRGSAAGLGSFLSVYSQDSTGVPGIHRSNDLFGLALATDDINGDRRDDLAVGAPWDWESRGWSTGSVTVLYGSDAGLTGTGAQRWSQDTPGIIGNSSLFDQDMPDSFGFQVALGDYNGDGFADLAASAPGAPVLFEGKQEDAGNVHLIRGSAAGLTATNAARYSQASPIAGDPETGDRFGLTLAAGDSNGNGPFELAIFVPGDENVTVLRGATDLRNLRGTNWNQNRTGVAGTVESGDGFGGSLRFAYFKGGTFAGLAIGIPGEDNLEGAVQILHGASGGLTASGAQYFTQDTPGIADVAQAGDRFGSFF